MQRTRTAADAAPPDFVAPELATLVERPPVGEGWLHEMKFDGYRLIVRIAAGRAQLLTRNGLDWTGKFKSLADDLARLPARTALIDGEAVVMAENGISSFAGLQQALSEGRHERIRIYLFDLLRLDGRDMRRLPLAERKAALEALLRRAKGTKQVFYSEHFDAPGEAVYRRACKLGLEGIIAKRADAPYRSGRARDWLKIKCIKGQEFVIGGFLPSDKAGRAFRSLLLGVFDGERFAYAGHVGTGFTMRVAADLRARMDRLHSETPTLDNVPRADRRRAVWVKPKLVCEVAFTERTADGELRHPSFKGLRTDKDPRQVTLETAAPR